MVWGSRAKEVATGAPVGANGQANGSAQGGGGGAKRRGASRQPAASRDKSEDLQGLAGRMARLEALTARGMMVSGNPGPKGGAQWACGCGFGANYSSCLTCFKCHQLRTHPSKLQAGGRPPSAAPSTRSRAPSVAFTTPCSTPVPSPGAGGQLETLETDLAWHVECLKLAKSMPPSRLREGKMSDLEG